MATPVVHQRVATPERWAKALERAIASGIEPLQIAGTGEWVVTSASKLGTVYRTDGINCECEAAVHGDEVCQHRAVVLFVLGRLSFPEPTASTENLASIPCPDCVGKGWNYAEVDNGRAWPDQIACRRCDGAGRVAIVIRTMPALVPALAAD
jgi:hypothetical protein